MIRWLLLTAIAGLACGQDPHAVGNGRRFSAKIGVIVGPGDEALEEILRYTLEKSRKSSSLLHLDPGLDLELVVERLDWPDTFQLSRGVCRILDAGVVGLVAGASRHEALRTLSSYSSTFMLPWIMPYSKDQGSIAPFKFGVTLQPDLLTPLSSVVSFLKYHSILFMYDSEAGPSRLLTVLRESGSQLIAAIRVASSTQALAHLRQIMSSNNASMLPVVLDTELPIAEELLSELSVQPYHLQRRFQFLLARTVDKEEFWRPEFLRLNVTALRWLNSTSPSFADFRFKWRSLSRLPLDERALLSYDAARVLARGLRRLVESEDASRLHALSDGRLPGTGGIDCLRSPVLPWSDGELVANYLQKVILKDGVTKEVRFSTKGHRTGYTVDVVATTPLQHVKIGEWTTERGLKMDIPAPLPIQMEDPTIRSTLKGQTIKVTTVLSLPYMGQEEGTDEFKGFCKDLLDALSTKLGFKYELHVNPEGRYGNQDRQGRWNGMIGEIIDGRADMAIAPVTITASRENEVDFTTPFMHASIGLLLKREEPASELGSFFFLQGFSASVWVGAIVAYVIMGAALYASLRFTSPAPTRLPPDDSGAEPASPSVCGSFWFVLGTGLFQSTGIYPKSIASRLASTVWWLFSLALGALYVSSLVAVLMGHRVEDASSAALHTMTATEIMEQFVKTGSPKIGVLKGGSTEGFFSRSRISPYRDYGQLLGRRPDLGLVSYQDGTKRVRESSGDFAMLMESPTISFISGKEPCDTTQPRENLPQTSSFGIPLRKDSEFLAPLSVALMMLQESGTIMELYTKWWTSDCSLSDQRPFSELYSGSLTLADVSGLFYLLIAGLGLVLAVTLVEIFIKQKHGQSNELPMK